MYLNLKKKYFLTIFSVLVLLTPLFYYIFSLIVILDCTRTKIIKYLTYPIYNIYEPNRKAFCKLTYLDKHKLIFFSDSTNAGKADNTTKSIAEYLENSIKKKVLTVDLGGGNADIYSEFVGKSNFINYSNIDYAVITLNLRIFSEQSYTFLKFYQNKQRYFSKVFHEPFKVVNLIELNKLIFNPTVNENKILNWKKRKVTINDITFKLGETENKDQKKMRHILKLIWEKLNMITQYYFQLLS